MKRVAVYAGSFDPLTLGHINIIRRGLRMFDKLIVAIAHNVKKTPLFSIDERTEIIHQSFSDLEGLEIDAFEGLLTDYATRRGAQAILRGLRGVTDFEYELQMAHMNRKLAPDIETLFLMTEGQHSFVSSRLVKEVASFGGDISDTVTPDVARRLQNKYKQA